MVRGREGGDRVCCKERVEEGSLRRQRQIRKSDQSASFPNASMDGQTYHGRGLSLTQLVFALKEELRRTAYSPSYVTRSRVLVEQTPYFLYSHGLDKLSQLDEDITTILATVREWRNSLIPINRLPEDILSLIPTHLSCQQDRLRASFICVHWRRAFLRRAELWSELFLWKGEDCVEAHLERSKGSILDVSTRHDIPVGTLKLISPHTGRIGSLRFLSDKWVDIHKFSETTSGLLPLLHTLEINIAEEGDLEGFDAMNPPFLPLFGNATHLQAFCFRSVTNRLQFINYFSFPSLVSFDFAALPPERFNASRLLDFLEASPKLRTVDIRLTGTVSLDGVLQGRVVILPDVEKFNLLMTDCGPGYELVAHISCPSARRTTLVQKDGYPEQAFCTSDSWDTIVRQYTKSPVEEVTLEIRTTPTFASKLTFQSADTAVIELNYHINLTDEDEDEDDFDLRSAGALEEVFTQATWLIQRHPQLVNVKRLNICHSFHFLVPISIPHIANEARRLFKALGPLDELTIYHCDIQPYSIPFLNVPEGYTTVDVPEGCITASAVFPSIKQLTISHPLHSSDEQCTAAIVGLAKSQHVLGIPFERVVIFRESIPMGMEEGLRQWVGSVEHHV